MELTSHVSCRPVRVRSYDDLFEVIAAAMCGGIERAGRQQERAERYSC
jgi:hypothetical protein